MVKTIQWMILTWNLGMMLAEICVATSEDRKPRWVQPNSQEWDWFVVFVRVAIVLALMAAGAFSKI